MNKSGTLQTMPTVTVMKRETHEVVPRAKEPTLLMPRSTIAATAKQAITTRAVTSETKQQAIQSGHLVTIEKNFSAIRNLRIDDAVAVEKARLTVAEIHAQINAIEREDFNQEELKSHYFGRAHDAIAADRRDIARETERKDSDHEVHLAQNRATLDGLDHPERREQQEGARINQQALAEQIVTEVGGDFVPCDSQHLYHPFAALTLHQHLREGKSMEQARHLTVKTLIQRIATYPITDVAQAAQQKQQYLDAMSDEKRAATNRALAAATESAQAHAERMESIKAKQTADFAKAFGDGDEDFFKQ